MTTFYKIQSKKTFLGRLLCFLNPHDWGPAERPRQHLGFAPLFPLRAVHRHLKLPVTVLACYNLHPAGGV